MIIEKLLVEIELQKLNILKFVEYKGNLIYPEKRKLFINYDKQEQGRYNYLDYKKPIHLNENNIIYPTSIDCEFYTGEIVKNFSEVKRYYLTTQMESIFHLNKITSDTNIFNTEDCNLKNLKYTDSCFKSIKSVFHELDLLLNNGHNITLIYLDHNDKQTYNYIKKLPVFISRNYGWFLLAELFMTSHSWGNDVKKLLLASNNDSDQLKRGWHGWNISMGKRLYASFTYENDKTLVHKDFARTPVIIIIDDFIYNYCISYVDCSAMFGGAARSLLAAAKAVGLPVNDKELLSKSEKEQIYKYPEFIERFKPYSISDIKLPVDILHKHQNNIDNVYVSLGLKHKNHKTPMTLGKPVNELYKSAIYKGLKIENSKDCKKFLDEKIFKFSNSKYFARDVRKTSAIGAKCFGGRAINNKPLNINYRGYLIADFDYASFYGSIMQSQPYPIGRTRIIDFDARESNNKYWTLKETEMFLNKRGLPLTWTIVVNTKEPLSFDFDVIPSWISGTKNDTEVKKLLLEQLEVSQGENFDLEWAIDPDDGLTKYLTREIYNGIITSDILEIINCFSKKYRDELKEKIIITAILYYDKDDQVYSFKELEDAYLNHTGMNTVKVRGNKIISTSNNCHKFYLFNSMGELIINDLLARRKLYDKKKPDEKPMNNTFKYLINTRAGVEMSKYFLQANPIVGNNITSRGRVACYVAEKIFKGFESITDGLACDVNTVIYPYRCNTINFEELIDLENMTNEELMSNQRLTLKPLGNYKKIEVYKDSEDIKRIKFHQINDNIKDLSYEEGKKILENLALNHIKTLFPKLTMFNGTYKKMFVKDKGNKTPKVTYKNTDCNLSFEIKDIYNGIATHGTANYLLYTDFPESSDAELKMRSYESKRHHYRGVVDDLGFITTEKMDKLPPNSFFYNTIDKPYSVKRSEPFIKEGILKINDYLKCKEKFDKKGLLPGDSYLKIGLLKELSLSQFKFKTLAQYKEWNRYNESLKLKCGQGLEMFFVNSEGNLNYEEMLITLDDLIKNQEERFRNVEVKTLREYFDKNMHASRDGKHPHHGLLSYLRSKIND